jgi:RNA polymerase sigma-70 factor, ECF subfamily
VAVSEPTPDSAETDGLLRQARAGDRAAFERLFARHRDDLCRVVALRLDARLRARLDPSDVVQESQLVAFRRLDDFLTRRPMSFRLWLRKTTHEQLLKARRRHLGTARRAAGREIPLPERSSLDLARHLLAGSESPGAELERQELARRVGRALARLPEADREVLLMRNFEGLSNPEVGALLDLDPGTVSKRHGRALLRLRALLLQDGLSGAEP